MSISATYVLTGNHTSDESEVEITFTPVTGDDVVANEVTMTVASTAVSIVLSVEDIKELARRLDLQLI